MSDSTKIHFAKHLYYLKHECCHYEKKNNSFSLYLFFKKKDGETVTELRMRALNQYQVESGQDWEHWTLLSGSETRVWQPWVASQVTEPTFIQRSAGSLRVLLQL